MAQKAWFVHTLIFLYDWYLKNRATFDMLGLFLAVLGTLFAVLSIRDGRQLTKELRAVFDHLTTKEIGAFPAYMAEVDRIISDARESVFIATDFPGHGSWRDRGRYGAYVKAIENRKAERVRRGHPLSVQVLCLDANGREGALEDRYPDSRWREYVKKGGFQRSRRLYEELENCQVSESRPQFLQQMLERQQRALDSDLRVGCDCDALAPDVFDADRAALKNLLSALPRRTPWVSAKLIPELATRRDRAFPSGNHAPQRPKPSPPRTISFQCRRRAPELSERRVEKRGPSSSSVTGRPGASSCREPTTESEQLDVPTGSSGWPRSSRSPPTTAAPPPGRARRAEAASRAAGRSTSR